MNSCTYCYAKKIIISGNTMQLLIRLLIISALSCAFAINCSAANCNKQKPCKTVREPCCGNMGGVQFCDSSAGRLVCNNGFYSSCYCDRHAVMDLEHLQGCCLWQGGVMNIEDGTGLVICNNGGVSEVCSLPIPNQSIASW